MRNALFRALLALLAFISLALRTVAADWPQFRGSTGLGITGETNLPLTWNAKTGDGIVWKTPLPKVDNPYSSPIVSGERIFVTCAINHPLDHRVLCFNGEDESLFWNTPVERLIDGAGDENS